MSFEQTTIFYNLVNHFVRYGEEIRHMQGKEEAARALAAGLAKMHGTANIKKVCAKANQKMKLKLYSI